MDGLEHKKTTPLTKALLVLFILCVVAIVLLSFEAKKIRKQVQSLDTKLAFFEFVESSKGLIDLTSKNFQVINNDLSVTINDVEQYLNGIKVSGRILNQTSTRLTTCEFSITVNGETQNFQINAIPSAYASKFSVVVANVPPDKARWAKISYINGQVNYYFY